MYTSLKALVFGEDLSSDMVGKVIGLVLSRVSHGSVVMDAHQLGQYFTLAFIGGWLRQGANFGRQQQAHLGAGTWWYCFQQGHGAPDL